MDSHFLTSNRTKIPYAVYFFIIILGCISSYYVYYLVSKSSQKGIIQRAETVASLIHSEDIQTLTGTTDDLANGNYLQLKSGLQSAKAANSDIKFISIIGKKDSQFFFYVDTEEPGTKDYSPPGQVYSEIPQKISDIFYSGKPASFYYSDRWGSFLGGYTPLVDEGGNIIAVLGIDIVSKDQLRQNITLALIPLFIALILFLIMVLVFNSLDIKNQKKDMHDKLEFIGAAEREIASPLGAVRTQIEYLVSQNTLSSQESHTVKEIYRQCLRVISNMESLLKVFIINEYSDAPVHKASFLIPEVLTNIKNELTILAEKTGTKILLSDSIKNAKSIFTNKDYFETIISKLLLNMIDYAQSGSQITISYSELEHSHQIHITDFGRGLPFGYHDVLKDSATLDPVKYSKDKYLLNLYTAKRTSEILGGNITYNSLGEENTYTIHLPK